MRNDKRGDNPNQGGRREFRRSRTKTRGRKVRGRRGGKPRKRNAVRMRRRNKGGAGGGGLERKEELKRLNILLCCWFRRAFLPHGQ